MKKRCWCLKVKKKLLINNVKHKEKYKNINANCAYLIIIVGLMGIDILNPALPIMMHHFDLNVQSTNELVIYYFLGMGLSLLCSGQYSDKNGRKKTIIIALMIVKISTVVSYFALHIESLKVLRFITGLGCGATPVIARTIILDMYTDPKDVKKRFSTYAVASQISPSTAPFIGAFLQQEFGWRFIFIGYFAICTISLVILGFLLQETAPAYKKNNRVFKSYVETFQNKHFIVYSFISCLIFSLTIHFFTYSPYLIKSMGYTPYHNGIMVLIYSLSLILGSKIYAIYLHNINDNKLQAMSICVYLLLLYVVTIFNVIDFYKVIITGVFTAIFCGITAPLTLTMSFQGVNTNIGVYSSVHSFIKMIGTGCYIWLLSLIRFDHEKMAIYFNFIITGTLILLTLLTFAVYNKKRTYKAIS